MDSPLKLPVAAFGVDWTERELLSAAIHLGASEIAGWSAKKKPQAQTFRL